jgi:glucose/arabinose dehydrogenase
MFLRPTSPLVDRSSLFLRFITLGAAALGAVALAGTACSDSKRSSTPAVTESGTPGASGASAAGDNGTAPGSSTPGGVETSAANPGNSAPGGNSEETGAGNGTPLDNGSGKTPGGGAAPSGPAQTASGGSGGGAPPASGFTPDATKDCGVPANPQVPNLQLTQVVTGLTRPVYLTQPRGETDRMFVVEKVGRVRIVRNGVVADQPFVDVSANVTERFEELGLIGLAFHPKYSENGRFYIYYSTLRNNTVFNELVEYKVSSDNPDVADPASARVLLEVQKPQDNHNGGDLEFGPDGFMYVGVGDGGGAGDQHGTAGNGQNLGALLGKILRIDVDGTGAGPNGAYGIPAGNLQQAGALPEIWSYGLRNPWRYSFDPCTGDMYIGDVGQDTVEEIDYEPVNTPGRNYGWRLMEANNCFNPNNGCNAQTQNITLPVASYTHAALGQSVTGGYVYRGSAIPDLRGTYLYSDYESKRIFALRMSNGSVAQAQTEITANINADGNVKGIGSFAQNNAGDLFAIEFAGRIFRIDPR